jgi:hypothetical protein
MTDPMSARTSHNWKQKCMTRTVIFVERRRAIKLEAHFMRHREHFDSGILQWALPRLDLQNDL